MSEQKLSNIIFKRIAENEKTSNEYLQLARPKEGRCVEYPGIRWYEYDDCQILYISDLHLDHVLIRNKCKSFEEVRSVLRKIAKRLDSSFREISPGIGGEQSVVVFVGDLTSSPAIFHEFVNMDYGFLKKSYFILGNHELWQFHGLSVAEIAHRYRSFSVRPILQNEIVVFSELFDDTNNSFSSHYMLKYEKEIISCDEAMQLSSSDLAKRFLRARVIMLAGIGFSGCNQEFNADNGIYRNVLDREQEIAESRRFNELYNHFIEATSKVNDRVIVVATHMPLENWSETPNYKDGVIYLSGHTHKNYFYDDGEKRIYADNQNGYFGHHFSFKCVYAEDEYDPFINYKDDIYLISKADYIFFNRAKKISMQLRSDYNSIFMLKKHGYYSFFVTLKNGDFGLLCGGSVKRIGSEPIEYYYNQMDNVIDRLSPPLEKYTILQNKIANTVKLFGGTGIIHGCIVDIDFLNHIFVNPIDSKITGYYATDMINKRVYTSIPALLEENAPVLYERYIQLLKDTDDNPFAIVTAESANDSHSSLYLDTSIYSMSRRIAKLQKLHSNILSVWYDDSAKPNNMLVQNKDI